MQSIAPKEHIGQDQWTQD
uniref:Uncharacterized protein n=1 Tax=Rhizophora mucronata TaxID=61149 RepID=A0A2P2QWZ0_RHIMU